MKLPQIGKITRSVITAITEHGVLRSVDFVCPREFYASREKIRNAFSDLVRTGLLDHNPVTKQYALTFECQALLREDEIQREKDAGRNDIVKPHFVNHRTPEMDPEKSEYVLSLKRRPRDLEPVEERAHHSSGTTGTASRRS